MVINGIHLIPLDIYTIDICYCAYYIYNNFNYKKLRYKNNMLNPVPYSKLEEKINFHPALKIKTHILSASSNISSCVKNVIAWKYTVTLWGTEFDMYEEDRKIVGKNGLVLEYLSVQEYKILCILIWLRWADVSIKDFFRMMRWDILQNETADTIYRIGISPDLSSLNKKIFWNLPISVLNKEEGRLSLNMDITLPEKSEVKPQPRKKISTSIMKIDVSELQSGIVKWIIETIAEFPSWIEQDQLLTKVLQGRQAEIDRQEIEWVLMSEDLEDTLEDMWYKIVSTSGKLRLQKIS